MGWMVALGLGSWAGSLSERLHSGESIFPLEGYLFSSLASPVSPGPDGGPAKDGGV